MITTENQYRATVNHLRQFEDALRNLEARHPSGKRTKRAQLEIDAVRAQADDLRAEIDEYDRLRSGDIQILTRRVTRRSGRAARESSHCQALDATSTGRRLGCSRTASAALRSDQGTGPPAWPASAMSPTR